jgi:uncharacterized protein YjbI with pentapeptide repeats
MKPLQALLALFACAALPALGELVWDLNFEFRTGTITVNGRTYTIEPNADLFEADLEGIDLWGIDLRHADLTSANLSGADLSEADLRGASLSGPNLSRVNLSGANLSRVNLSGADLEGADLEGADLEGADLEGVNLSGANLSGAILDGVWSGGIRGTPSALPTGWILTGGYLIGPHANLWDRWEQAFHEVDLEGVDLSGVWFDDITGTPSALPAGWIFSNGYLIGPHANLEEADLEGVNLSDAGRGYENWAI